ncbi:MAG TPA: hypothetical protein VF746_24880 [Longimicrobium sp.]|jgi:hypothetical protein
MRKRVLTPVLLCAALAACSGDGTGPGGGELTRAEAEAINRAILALGSGVAQGGTSQAQASRAAAAAPNSFTYDFNTTAPCKPSGSVALAGHMSGSFDDQAQTAQLQADVAVRHQACEVPTDDGGTIRLTGDPRIDVGLNAASNAGGVTALRVTERGAFTWAKGAGSSGRCTVDVTAELVAGTQNVHVFGSFCGFTFDEVGPIS